MAEIVQNINSLDEFKYLKENYKSISSLSQKQLKFYFLNLENGSSLLEVLNFLKDESKRVKIDFKVIEKNADGELIYLKVLRKSLNSKNYPEAIIYLDKKSSNIILMSDEEKDNMKIIKSLTEKMFPYLSKKFIKSNEMRSIITNLIGEGYQITASMISVKRWWEKVKTSEMEYPKGVPIEKIFEDLDKQKSFINSILFNVFDSKKENNLLRVYISRKGLVKFLEGYYEIFQDNILSPLLKETAKEKKLLKDRSRKEESLKPLRIAFERLEGFSSIEVTRQFSKSISRTRELSLAVLHNGNPYFYASITNNLDGSVFDVVFQNTQDGSELVIIPQYSVSSNSLSKFFSLVYSQFGEGKLSEYNYI